MKKRESVTITYTTRSPDKPRTRGDWKGTVLHFAEPLDQHAVRDEMEPQIFIFGARKNEEKRRGAVTKAWAAHKDTPLAPLFLNDAIRLAPLSENFGEIETMLGEKLSSEQRARIQSLFDQNLRETISETMSEPWERFAHDLRKMIKIGRQFITWFDPARERRQRAGQIPTELAVMAHFATGSNADDYHAAIAGVHMMVEECELALGNIAARRRRGKKSDVCVARICQVAISIAKEVGTGLKLPSNGDRDRGNVFFETPLLGLTRYLVALTKSAGLWSVEKSRLNGPEKAAAAKAVRVTFTKTDGALLDHLRKALKQHPMAR